MRSLALLAICMVGCGPVTRYNVPVTDYSITETYHVDGGKPVTHILAPGLQSATPIPGPSPR